MREGGAGGNRRETEGEQEGGVRDTRGQEGHEVAGGETWGSGAIKTARG